MTEDQKDALAQSLADVAKAAMGDQEAAPVLYQAVVIALSDELDTPEQVASVVLETAEDTYASIMSKIRKGGRES